MLLCLAIANSPQNRLLPALVSLTSYTFPSGRTDGHSLHKGDAGMPWGWSEIPRGSQSNRILGPPNTEAETRKKTYRKPPGLGVLYHSAHQRQGRGLALTAYSWEPGWPARRCSSVPPMSPLSHASKSLPLPCPSPYQPTPSPRNCCPEQLREWQDKAGMGAE